MKIIAWGHRKNVGKDTAARFLAHMFRVTYPGSSIIKHGFADKIYDICFDLYGWAGFQSREYYATHPEAKNNFIKPLSKTVRRILIDMGTPAIREQVYDRTWIDYLLKTSLNNKADLLIITDLRFPNEFNSIKDLNGFCIKINRPSIPITHDEADDALQDCNEWDAVIDNETTPGQLFVKIKQTCSLLLKEQLNG